MSKKYGRTQVLSDISFEIADGSVTGLAGPNGSGKTTLFRLLAGLGYPSFGRITHTARGAHGQGDHRPEVGVFLGVDNLHPGRTVRETLRLVAFLSGQARGRADERLTWSGLETVGGRLVKSLSLGMKVRLGLAIATLRPTSFLFLDEPLNGLDIEAIAWVKGVIREYADSGGVVFISSHLLNELEAIADRVLILSGGRIVRDLDLANDVDVHHVFLRVDNDQVLERALSTSGWAYRFSDGVWVINAQLDEIGRFAFNAGVPVLELHVDPRESLEKTFTAVAAGEFRPRQESEMS